MVSPVFHLVSLSPTPDIAWYKKGGDLPSDKAKFENFNKALRITNVSEEDSGEYFCLASNKMGSIRHTISVRVKGTLCAFLITTVSPALNSTAIPPSRGGCVSGENTSTLMSGNSDLQECVRAGGKGGVTGGDPPTIALLP